MKMLMQKFILLTLHYLVITECQKPVKSKGTVQPLVYLFKYGYVSTNDFTENLPLKSNTITSFQKFAGLPLTGILDGRTFQQMRQPRCGMIDEVEQQNENKIKTSQRTTSWLSLFDKREEKLLTWSVKNGGQQITKAKVVHIITKAFKLWSSACDIRFKQVRNNPDIEISFQSRGHGDGNYFDGRGGILAHAFYPQSGKQGSETLVGDIHFDNAEQFEAQSKEGRNYFVWLATHEIGHSLGLRHSQIKGSVMFPWYDKQKHKMVKLHKSDIRALRRLYKNVELAPPTTSSGLSTPSTDMKTPSLIFTTNPESTLEASIGPMRTTGRIRSEGVSTSSEDSTSTEVSTTGEPVTTHETTLSLTSTATPKVSTKSESGDPTETLQTSTTNYQEPTVETSSTMTSTNQPATEFKEVSNAVMEGSSINPFESSTQPAMIIPSTTEISSTINSIETTKSNENEEKAGTTKDVNTLTCPRAVDQIEAVYHSSRYGITFVFNENNMLSFVRPNSLEVLVVSRFNYLPKIRDGIDAVLNIDGENRGPYQIIFSGESYYLYRDFVSNVFKKAGPYSIHDEENPMNFQFPRWVKKIDAAMTWTSDGMTYFFTDALYWKYDAKQKKMADGYPKQIKTRWEGIPDQVDAALSSEDLDVTYFISGDMVYILNDRTGYVRETMTVAEFLKCP
ncbi:macrophage metalloelastase-like [Clytia hemisphaerica]|uniref:Peptidase metallopeptidase domain-containing protein n=1 Tax=Clytia hemisphaerica TaxID=252671 RepID=A0A7M5WMB9_9CNID